MEYSRNSHNPAKDVQFLNILISRSPSRFAIGAPVSRAERFGFSEHCIPGGNITEMHLTVPSRSRDKSLAIGGKEYRSA